MVSLDVNSIAMALEKFAALDLSGVPLGKKAAVAAIVRNTGEGAELLFIRRAEYPKDPWSGQMGLPGGRVDEGDASPFAAAVRETLEEVGLDLTNHARPIGRLSETRTHLPIGGVPVSVIPFVFALTASESFTLNYEVQETLWIPLTFFSNESNRSSFTWVRRGIPLPMPCYSFAGRNVWGLTLRIVEELLEVCRIPS
jgi:8-oxo-dGTP pyrophosphatase MutT (NUDIX family)